MRVLSSAMRVLCVLALASLPVSCARTAAVPANTAETNHQCQVVGTDRDIGSLQRLGQQHGLPLIVNGGSVLACSCGQRSVGGGTEARASGGGTEPRSLNGGVDDRVTGGAVEDRRPNGATEQRTINGATEDRPV